MAATEGRRNLSLISGFSIPVCLLFKMLFMFYFDVVKWLFELNFVNALFDLLCVAVARLLCYHCLLNSQILAF